jgi:hypothetical protein
MSLKHFICYTIAACSTLANDSYKAYSGHKANNGHRAKAVGRKRPCPNEYIQKLDLIVLVGYIIPIPIRDCLTRAAHDLSLPTALHNRLS